MRLVHLLPERWQTLIDEAVKFGLVGTINLVINYAVFNALALTIFVSGQLKATVVATVVATYTSYLMNRHWTYRDRPKSTLRREYLLFFLFNATGLLIELGFLGLAKYGLGFDSLIALNVAKTIGVVLGTVFRFWSYRTFVFPADAARDIPADATHGIPTGAAHDAPGDPAHDAPAGAGCGVSGRGDEPAAAGTASEPTRQTARVGADAARPTRPDGLDEAPDVTLEAELAVELGQAERPIPR